MTYTDQGRDQKGKFASKAGELKGAAIALRLPASLDTQVRQAAAWQSAADNIALRDWVEGACKDRVSGSTSPAPTRDVLVVSGHSIDQIRAAADRVALTIQPRERLRIQKAFKALLGELLANGE